MVELTTAEHVIYYMRTKIKLSRYDEKFIDSLQSLSQVTTNQVELFYKLILKYRRQFAKDELHVEPLINLPWVMPVVESAKQYTDGHVIIDNDMLYFRCPYNRNFISKFREVSDNPFNWNKETRQYEAKFGQNTLKFLLSATIKHFKYIHYCDETIRLLESLHEYSTAKYWDPTLVRVNGRLYVVATNAYLEEAISDIELNTDAKTLALLASHGITIDKELYDENDPRMNFMANNNTNVEYDNVINMISWLKELGCDMVYFNASSVNPVKKKLITELTDNNIFNKDLSTYVTPITLEKEVFPTIINFKSTPVPLPKGICKVIKIVNSQPIDIK